MINIKALLTNNYSIPIVRYMSIQLLILIIGIISITGCSDEYSSEQTEAENAYIFYLDNMIAGDLALASSVSTGWAQKEVHLERMYRYFLNSEALDSPKKIEHHKVNSVKFSPQEKKYWFKSIQRVRYQSSALMKTPHRIISSWGTVVWHEGQWKVGYTNSGWTDRKGQKQSYTLKRFVARKLLIDQQYLYIGIGANPSITNWKEFLMLDEDEFNAP